MSTVPPSHTRPPNGALHSASDADAERARLIEIANRRAERLQLLQQAGQLLASSLDETEVVRRLAREVERLVSCDGVTIVLCYEDGTHRPAARRAGGVETPPRPGGHCDVLVEAVVRERKPITLDTTKRDETTGEPTRGRGSLLGVPALSGDSLVAVIAVWTHDRPLAFPAEDQEALLTVGAHAGSALSNARLYAASQRERRRSEALADIARAVSSSLRLDDVMDLILRHTVALLRVQGADLALVRGDQLEVVAATGTARSLLGARLPIEASISGRALRLRCSQIVNDAASDPETFDPTRRAADIRNALMVPLFTSDGPVGVLSVINRASEFTDEDAAVLQRLGEHVAVAIVNARLFEEHHALGERYRRVLETASDAIVITDRERRVSFTNPAADAMFGVPSAMGMPVSAFVPPEILDRVRAYEDRAFAGEPQRYEAVVLCGPGIRRHVSVSTAPLRDGDEIVGVVASLRDITDERRARDAAAESEARYTRLVESASDAIFTVDAQGVLTSVNRAMERAVGKRRLNLLGTRFVHVLDPHDREAADALMAEVIEGQRCRGEFRYLAGDGSVRHCSIMATPIIESGSVTGALGIVRDVTDEKRLTEQLVQQEKLAAVGQLVSGVAHELNNPLAGVMAFAQLLLAMPQPDPEQRRAIESIHQESKRAAKIVSNLLTFARQHQPERTLADINRVVTDTVELRRYAIGVEQIDLELRLDPALPLTWADPFQLQQVILNLVTNAEHALGSWEGEKKLVVATERCGDMLQVRVSDSGPGIAAPDLPRIFNPFFTTKPVGQGTGLGLSISDGIVREHGGRISVVSSLGSGTTFTIELPHVSPPETERDGDAGTAQRAPVLAGRQRRVLVVDDEPAIRKAIARYLGTLGHTVDTASGGQEALERVASTSYDAAVIDLRMPEMSGDVLYAALRARAPALAERVLFLTGDTQSDSARALLDATGRPSLSKPFQLQELAALLLPHEDA